MNGEKLLWPFVPVGNIGNKSSKSKSNPTSTPWEVETSGSRGMPDRAKYSGDCEGPGTATVAVKACLEP